MSKKDYIKFATMLKDLKDIVETREEIIIFERFMVRIVKIFQEDSELFDSDKFWDAVYGKGSKITEPKVKVKR